MSLHDALPSCRGERLKGKPSAGTVAADGSFKLQRRLEDSRELLRHRAAGLVASAVDEPEAGACERELHGCGKRPADRHVQLPAGAFEDGVSALQQVTGEAAGGQVDRKSTRLNSSH